MDDENRRAALAAASRIYAAHAGKDKTYSLPIAREITGMADKLLAWLEG